MRQNPLVRWSVGRRRASVLVPIGLVVLVLLALSPLVAFLVPGEDPALGRAADVAQLISLLLGLPSLVAILLARHRTRASVVHVDKLEAAADQLAESMRARWVAEAAARGITLPAPVEVDWELDDVDLVGDAGVRVPGATPEAIPGAPHGERTLVRGGVTRLHDDLYVGSRHGRLVLLGPGGCGKTGALLLLLLAALAHRRGVGDDLRGRVPVPVWGSLGLWDVERTDFLPWVAATLERDHPYLAAEEFGPGAVLSLLRSGRVALFLDGLDELAADHRVRALQKVEREAGGLRIVLTSRTDEYLDARTDGRWNNAVDVRLRPVGPEAAASYLLADQPAERRAAWREVADTLVAAPEGVAARVLRDPLRLSLARDAYRGADPQPLTTFTDAEALDAHLLERFVATTYSRPGDDASVQVLAWIALRLGPEQRDLAWWSIPAWVGRSRLAVAAGAAAALVAWVLFSVSTMHVVGTRSPLELLSPAVVGVVTGALAWRGLRRAARGHPAVSLPRGVDLHRPRGRTVLRALLLALVLSVLGVVAGFSGLIFLGFVLGMLPEDTSPLALDLAVLRAVFSMPAGLTIVLTITAVVWPCILIRGMITDPRSGGGAATPRSRYRADLVRVVVVGLALLLAASLAVFVVLERFRTSSLVESLSGDAWIGAAFAVAATFGSVGSSPSLALALCRFVTSRLPLRGSVISVLEDAADRGVLRRAGTVYQFRHAALQDRLARRAR